MSLEALRALRARAEEALTMELARIAHELTGMEARCEALEAARDTDAAAYRTAVERGLAVEAAWEWHARLDAHEAALAQTRQAVHRLRASWSGVQGQLVEASVERKILDRLAERRRQERRFDADRRIQQALDDIAQHRRRERGTDG